MRIAQIAPLFEAVPPKLYGGTERVVYSLTEALVAPTGLSPLSGGVMFLWEMGGGAALGEGVLGAGRGQPGGKQAGK